jgi:hypothetical protein
MDGRSVLSFSMEAGLSKDYMYRLLHGKFTDSPRISTLEKIASASRSVTLEELLIAAGYHSSVKDSVSDPYWISSAVRASILNSLYEKGFSLQIEKESSFYPLTIKLSDCPVSVWNFIALKPNISDPVQARLLAYYTRFLFEKTGSDEKISFVTTSVEDFKKCIEKRPINLSVNMTVILIDTSSVSIKKEAVLSSRECRDASIKFF